MSHPCPEKGYCKLQSITTSSLWLPSAKILIYFELQMIFAFFFIPWWKNIGSSSIPSDDILLHDVSMSTSLPMWCSHIHRLFYALRGQQCTAQGNALGINVKAIYALKGQKRHSKCRMNRKMRPHVKYSLKGEIFLDFMLTFAMSLMIFACLDLQH